MALERLVKRGSDPILGALKGKSTFHKLVLELATLVIDSMILDNRCNEAKASVCGVDTHNVDAIKEELKRLADYRWVPSRLQVLRAKLMKDRSELDLGFLVTSRSLLLLLL